MPATAELSLTTEPVCGQPEQNGITNIDITFGGLNVNESKQQIVNVLPGPPQIEAINWKDDASVAGDGTFNDGILTVVKGNVTGRAFN